MGKDLDDAEGSRVADVKLDSRNMQEVVKLCLADIELIKRPSLIMPKNLVRTIPTLH